jgi:hypothetical protein
MKKIMRAYQKRQRNPLATGSNDRQEAFFDGEPVIPVTLSQEPSESIEKQS